MAKTCLSEALWVVAGTLLCLPFVHLALGNSMALYMVNGNTSAALTLAFLVRLCFLLGTVLSVYLTVTLGCLRKVMMLGTLFTIPLGFCYWHLLYAGQTCIMTAGVCVKNVITLT